MAKQKARIGIIGFGGQGSAYIRLLKAGLIKNAVLGAVCDIDENKLNAQCEKFNITVPKFTDHNELLKSGTVDAVVVTTPHYFHPPIVIDALNAGIHAMSDKPAGVYTKQVKEMIDVAEQHPDLLFGLMLNQRTNKVYNKMRDMIAQGKIGTVKRVNWMITDWYRSQSYYDASPWRATWKGEGGGVLFNQAPHQIDLLQWIVGMMPSKLQAHCAFGKWHDIETEDDVTVYMEFPNGATGVFITATADYPGTNRLEILGTKGKLVCTNGMKLEITYSKQDEREFNRTYKNGFGTPGSKKAASYINPVSGQHVTILNNFANAVLGKEKLFVHGSEGLNGVQFMDACLLSEWLKKEVTLPIDDDLYYNELEKRSAGRSLRETAGNIVLDTKGTY